MPDEELMEMGIPRSHIRLEVIPPEARFRTEEQIADAEPLVS